MSTKRPTTARTASRVTTRQDLRTELDRADLTPEEEKVLRMRYGVPVEAGAALSMQSGDGEARDRLVDLEAQLLRAMRANGQISRKDMIVAQLKGRKG